MATSSSITDILKTILSLVWLITQVVGLVVWSWIKWLLPSRQKSLEGEIVLVTGAGSGIGQLMAVKFAQKGSTVILWDINPDGNKQTAEMIKAVGGTSHSYVVDVSKMTAVSQAAQQVKQDIGHVTILVNNAGIVIGRTLLDVTEDEFIKTMSVNALAHVWTLKSFLPDMIERNHGHVVTIASVMAYVGYPKLSAYCSSKGAAKNIHEATMREVLVAGADNVKFTLVNPYLIHTGMFAGVKIDHENLLQGQKPEYVVDRILHAVQTNQEVLCVPRTMYLLLGIQAWLPVSCFLVVEKFFNVWHSMDGLTGRNKVD